MTKSPSRWLQVDVLFAREGIDKFWLPVAHRESPRERLYLPLEAETAYRNAAIRADAGYVTFSPLVGDAAAAAAISERVQVQR